MVIGFIMGSGTVYFVTELNAMDIKLLWYEWILGGLFMSIFMFIVSPVERYDMRDYTYSRISLHPGTPRYEEYYGKYPEKKAVDDDLRQRADKSGVERLEKDAVNEHIALSGFYGTMAVSPPKVVNSFKRMPLHPPGRPDVIRRELDS